MSSTPGQGNHTTSRDAGPDSTDAGAPAGASASPEASPADPVGVEPPSSLEEVAPAVIFLLITLCIGADFVADVAGDGSAFHLTGMAVGTVLSLGGLVHVLRLLSRSRARSRHLSAALDRTRADSVRWREQTGQVMAGLGSLIDKQFAEWGLSPSERGVALLLLKGLSLKEIAAARGAAEPTVRQQAQSVYRKASLSGRAELSAFFLEDLLLPVGSVGGPPPAPVPAGR